MARYRGTHFDLTGKTALVTGASSGLGREFAFILAAAGAQVALAARRQDRLDALAAEIAAKGGRAHSVVMDVTDAASVMAGFRAAEAALGPVTIAIANAGVSGEMVRDLMVAAVERRFSATKTPHAVEWLSDNGSAYIAKDTADMARALGLKMLFTPVRSPESNGMSESFVKTLKRDYARLNVLTDADAILAMLPYWIEDYCEVHPHSGLKFRSPREFIRLSA